MINSQLPLLTNTLIYLALVGDVDKDNSQGASDLLEVVANLFTLKVLELITPLLEFR